MNHLLLARETWSWLARWIFLLFSRTNLLGIFQFTVISHLLSFFIRIGACHRAAALASIIPLGAAAAAAAAATAGTAGSRVFITVTVTGTNLVIRAGAQASIATASARASI